MTDSTRPPTGTDDVRVTATEAGVVIEVTVAAPVETVWSHLRDPELIHRWHGWDYDGLADEIEVIYTRHVHEDAAAHVLRTRGGPAPGSVERGDRFDLRPADPDDPGGATVVRITRGPQGTDDDWDAMYDDITQGWVSFLAQLRFAIEQHPGDDRRTVFCGSFAGPSTPARHLLGLVALRPGEPYAIAPAPGLPLAGRVWFCTDDQVGLAVDDYGPGLVVVADKPGDLPGTAATSMIIVSTFGLPDAKFAGIEAGWHAWWADHFSTPDDPATTVDGPG